MRRQEAIKKEDSALMSKEDAAKPAAETESSRSRCISCRMFTFHVKYVRENVITEKFRGFVQGTFLCDGDGIMQLL